MRILSLGAGVQSTTLALLMAHGKVEPVDHAIFADTQWEPRAVYDHLSWLRSGNVLPFPVHIVSLGDIRQNILDRRNTGGGRFAAVPWFIINPDGTWGMGRRQCSYEYKLKPIMHKVRDLLGVSRMARIAPGEVEVNIGISLDEAHRMREAEQQYMRNVYPLVDLGMTRTDCLGWLQRNGYPRPPKSSCIGCPFTSDERWLDMKQNRPEEWSDAVEVDRALRLGDARAMNGTEFMHEDRIPLDEVKFDNEKQPDLFGNECLGMCGV